MNASLATALVVGGFPLLRQGIAFLIGRLPWLDLCGETGEASRARQLCEKHRPDLIVLDMELADGNSLGLLRDFSQLHPAARTLAVSELEDAHSLHRVFKAGACGYVSKWDIETELSNGLLRLLMTKERFVSGRMSYLLMEQMKEGKMMDPPDSGLNALSNREMEVFRLLGRGLGTSAAASSLGLSVKTIETHHLRIKRKLGIRSGEELRRRAVEARKVESGQAIHA